MVGAAPRALLLKARFPDAFVQRGDVVIRSTLDASSSLNDHLMSLWRSLKFERPYLKKLKQQGVPLVCHCKVRGGPVHLQPNAAEMLHLLGAELVVEAK